MMWDEKGRKNMCVAEVTEGGGRNLPDLRRQFGEVVCVSVPVW